MDETVERLASYDRLLGESAIARTGVVCRGRERVDRSRCELGSLCSEDGWDERDQEREGVSKHGCRETGRHLPY